MIVGTAGAIATLLIALGGLSTQALGGGSLPVSSVDRPLISGSDRWQRRLHRRIRRRQIVSTHRRRRANTLDAGWIVIRSIPEGAASAA